MKGILKTNKSTHCVTTSNKEPRKQIKTKKPSSLPATPSKEKCVTFENYSPPGVECPTEEEGIVTERRFLQEVDRRVGKEPLVPVRRLKSYQFVQREQSIQPVERKSKLKRYKRPFTMKSSRHNMNGDILNASKNNSNHDSKTINKPPINNKSKLSQVKNRNLDEKGNLDEKSAENCLERKSSNVEKKESKKKVVNRNVENSLERKVSSVKSFEECKQKEIEDESGDSENYDDVCKPETKPSVIMIDIVF